MHDHATDGGLALYHDRASAREVRLHLDNSHDLRTSGWPHGQLVRHHEALHVEAAERLDEIEAAANLVAECLASAPPAVVERVLGDRSLYLTDANGTLYLAEPAGVWDPAQFSCSCAEVIGDDHVHCHCSGACCHCSCQVNPSEERVLVYYEDEERPDDAEPLYRLTAQVPDVDLLEATKASLAASRAYLDALKESEGPIPSDAPEVVEARPAGQPATSGAPHDRGAS